jgi:putative DNA primase/helicase
LLDAPTPFYLIDGARQGAGKGLLATCAAALPNGCAPNVLTLAGGREEQEKTITSLLLAGQDWILLDNLTTLASPVLSAALTADWWHGRLLGVNRMARLRNRATWVGTGNNVELSGEIARRVVPIRLEPPVERPEERTGFRHRLPGWAYEHRTELVSVCLSLIQHWIDAGMPLATKTLGSYERWAAVMGGILAHAGVGGFLEAREALYVDSDNETAEWRAFCGLWWKRHAEHAVTAKDLLPIAKGNNVLMSVWAGRREIAGLQRLGHALRGMRGRVFGAYRILAAGRDAETGSAAYSLSCLPTDPGAGGD